MESIYLNDKIKFSVEPKGKNIRLIASEADVELACRKESLKRINNFLSIENEHLFKGRLQLIKHKNQIDVKIKGLIVGSMEVQQFKEALNKSK